MFATGQETFSVVVKYNGTYVDPWTRLSLKPLHQTSKAWLNTESIAREMRSQILILIHYHYQIRVFMVQGAHT